MATSVSDLQMLHGRANGVNGARGFVAHDKRPGSRDKLVVDSAIGPEMYLLSFQLALNSDLVFAHITSTHPNKLNPDNSIVGSGDQRFWAILNASCPRPVEED